MKARTIIKEPICCKLKIDDRMVEQVMEFNYLNVNVTSPGNMVSKWYCQEKQIYEKGGGSSFFLKCETSRSNRIIVSIIAFPNSSKDIVVSYLNESRQPIFPSFTDFTNFILRIYNFYNFLKIKVFNLLYYHISI